MPGGCCVALRHGDLFPTLCRAEALRHGEPFPIFLFCGIYPSHGYSTITPSASPRLGVQIAKLLVALRRGDYSQPCVALRPRDYFSILIVRSTSHGYSAITPSASPRLGVQIAKLLVALRRGDYSQPCVALRR
jgi:hypothetical protein